MPSLNPSTDLGAAVVASISNNSVNAAQNLLACTYDPILVAVGGTAFATGVLYLSKVIVTQQCLVSNIVYTIGTVGVTLTAAQNLLGLYDSSGNLLATSTDQSAAFVSAANLAAAKFGALITAVTIPPGIYYIAVLTNGTTGVAFGRISNTGPSSANLSASTGWRWGSVLTGQTSLPSTVTMGAVSWSNIPVWLGLS